MIIFKNLLADEEDFCYGVQMKDGRVFCLCGCGGYFEKDDYKIISQNVDKASNITYQKRLYAHKEYFFEKLKEYKKEIISYGYTWAEMYGITAVIGKLLFQYNVETFRLYDDGAEGVINDISEFDTHNGWFGVEKKTLESALEKDGFDNFFFEEWDESEQPIAAMEYKQYVVCMDPQYVRDAQMLNTQEMTDEEFENIDWQSSELDDNWHDMEPTPFIAVVCALSEEEALLLAAKKYRYDKRCLFALPIPEKKEKESCS